jgi:hypothetical protein
LLCTLSSYTLSPCSSLIVRGKDAHPKNKRQYYISVYFDF